MLVMFSLIVYTDIVVIGMLLRLVSWLFVWVIMLWNVVLFVGSLPELA